MPKRTLCLYVDDNLIDAAKSIGINLSSEFDEWLKIRMNKLSEVKEQTEDPDLIIAQHRAEIMKLETQKERRAMQSEKDKEFEMIVSDVVDNILEEKEAGDNPNYIDKSWHEIITYRSTGLQFLVKKRMNKVLTLTEAEQILTAELKKRGIKI